MSLKSLFVMLMVVSLNAPLFAQEVPEDTKPADTAAPFIARDSKDADAGKEPAPVAPVERVIVTPPTAQLAPQYNQNNVFNKERDILYFIEQAAILAGGSVISDKIIRKNRAGSVDALKKDLEKISNPKTRNAVMRLIDKLRGTTPQTLVGLSGGEKVFVVDAEKLSNVLSRSKYKFFRYRFPLFITGPLVLLERLGQLYLIANMGTLVFACIHEIPTQDFFVLHEVWVPKANAQTGQQHQLSKDPVSLQ